MPQPTAPRSTTSAVVNSNDGAPLARRASSPQASSPPPSLPRGWLSHLEEQFALHLRALGLPEPEREHRFAPPRKFRFDFAWPEIKVAIEIDGGQWVGGRHTRGAGFLRDCEKLNLAALAGWTVLRFSGASVKSGEAARLTALALSMKGAA